MAQVVIADATATWATNVTLSVIGTTPADRSLALPLDLLLLAESEASVAVDVKRLTELLPGLAAEVRVSSARRGRLIAGRITPVTSFSASGNDVGSVVLQVTLPRGDIARAPNDPSYGRQPNPPKHRKLSIQPKASQHAASTCCVAS